MSEETNATKKSKQRGTTATQGSKEPVKNSSDKAILSEDKQSQDHNVSNASEDFAIVQYGKHQFYLVEGMKLDVPRIKVEEGKEFVFDNVMALSKNGKFKLGTPFVEGATVKVFVIKHGKGPKKYGFKYKAKSRYRRKWGYRRLYTRVRVIEIAG